MKKTVTIPTLLDCRPMTRNFSIPFSIHFLGDVLGSVRQLANESGEIMLAKDYAPYGETLASAGDGASAYGFTGEWTDVTGLVYLRARYYAPWQGRFMTRDMWGGNVNQPMSYNMWLYVYGNPVNLFDPNGHYARDLHYDLSYQIAKGIDDTYGFGLDIIPLWIARGNYRMDIMPLAADPRGGHPEFHFEDSATIASNLLAATSSREPFLFGAALHQLQDWFSHYNEGYRWPGTAGHGVDSWKAGCSLGGGPCRRSQKKIDEFFEEYPTARETLSTYYSQAIVSEISDDKVVDLYIQTLRWTKGVEAVESLRNKYGYDTDYYFGFTSRDTAMGIETVQAIDFFYSQSKFDTCDIIRFLFAYDPPTDSEIIAFLQTGNAP